MSKVSKILKTENVNIPMLLDLDTVVFMVFHLFIIFLYLIIFIFSSDQIQSHPD